MNRAEDMFGSPLNQISETELQADSKIRRKDFWVWKSKSYPDVVYIPLSQRLKAKALSESELPEVLLLPVAVYRKNHAESRDRPLDLYEYVGDDKR